MLLLVMLLSILDPAYPLSSQGTPPPNPCLCAFSSQDICALESGTCVCISDSGWHAIQLSTAQDGSCDQTASWELDED